MALILLDEPMLDESMVEPISSTCQVYRDLFLLHEAAFGSVWNRNKRND